MNNTKIQIRNEGGGVEWVSLRKLKIMLQAIDLDQCICDYCQKIQNETKE